MKPLFQLIARDLNSDSEGWCWLAVVRFTGGPLAMAEDGRTVTDEQIQEIYNFLAAYGIHVASSGNGCAGHRYSNEPFLQWFTEHVVISQSGGLDV